MAKRSSRRSRPPANRPLHHGVPFRLAITLLVPCSLSLLQSIGLPGVDTSAFAASSVVARGTVSAFALGITPFVVAAGLVELVAAVVPRWSASRLDGPAGRATLARATAFFGLVLAGFQAWGIAALLSSPSLRAVGGQSEPWQIVVTLMAGSSCLVLLASVAGDRALAGGLALLTAGAPLVTLVTGLVGRADGPTTPALVLVSLGLVGTVALTVITLRPRRPTPPPEPADVDGASPYRAPATPPGAPRAAVPSPASGVSPVLITAALLTVPGKVAGPSGAMKDVATALTADLVFLPAAVTLLVVVTVGMGWLFNQPSRIAAHRLHVDHEKRGYVALLADARAELVTALARTVLFVAALFLMDQIAAGLRSS